MVARIPPRALSLELRGFSQRVTSGRNVSKATYPDAMTSHWDLERPGAAIQGTCPSRGHFPAHPGDSRTTRGASLERRGGSRLSRGDYLARREDYLEFRDDYLGDPGRLPGEPRRLSAAPGRLSGEPGRLPAQPERVPGAAGNRHVPAGSAGILPAILEISGRRPGLSAAGKFAGQSLPNEIGGATPL